MTFVHFVNGLLTRGMDGRCSVGGNVKFGRVPVPTTPSLPFGLKQTHGSLISLHLNLCSALSVYRRQRPLEPPLAKTRCVYQHCSAPARMHKHRCACKQKPTSSTPLFEWSDKKTWHYLFVVILESWLMRMQLVLREFTFKILIEHLSQWPLVLLWCPMIFFFLTLLISWDV